MRDKPDSEAKHLLGIEVADTPAHDNPQIGAVTLRLRQTTNTTRVVRMTMKDAVALSKALDEYFEEQ